MYERFEVELECQSRVVWEKLLAAMELMVEKRVSKICSSQFGVQCSWVVYWEGSAHHTDWWTFLLLLRKKSMRETTFHRKRSCLSSSCHICHTLLEYSFRDITSEIVSAIMTLLRCIFTTPLTKISIENFAAPSCAFIVATTSFIMQFRPPPKFSPDVQLPVIPQTVVDSVRES